MSPDGPRRDRRRACGCDRPGRRRHRRHVSRAVHRDPRRQRDGEASVRRSRPERFGTSSSATRFSSCGANFGTGSSRENVPAAMRAAGIRCVVAKSFARIFHRNCINLGMPAIRCPEAVEAARAGSTVYVEIENGAVDVDGQVFHCDGAAALHGRAAQCRWAGTVDPGWTREVSLGVACRQDCGDHRRERRDRARCMQAVLRRGRHRNRHGP